MKMKTLQKTWENGRNERDTNKKGSEAGRDSGKSENYVKMKTGGEMNESKVRVISILSR